MVELPLVLHSFTLEEIHYQRVEGHRLSIFMWKSPSTLDKVRMRRSRSVSTHL